jgi:hypothetical protein
MLPHALGLSLDQNRYVPSSIRRISEQSRTILTIGSPPAVKLEKTRPIEVS